MPTYRTPGVYIEEISTLPASVVAVETAIPAFIGLTESGTAMEPVRITSMLEFTNEFGGPPTSATIDIPGTGSAAYDFTESAALDSLLYYAVQMFYNNGGGPCWIVSAGDFDNSTLKASLDDAIDALEYEDEPTLICVPDSVLLTDINHHYEVAKKSLAQCAKLQDRFSIIDVKAKTDGAPDSADDSQELRDRIGTQNLKYGGVYYPNLVTTLVPPDSSIKVNFTPDLTYVYETGTTGPLEDTGDPLLSLARTLQLADVHEEISDAIQPLMGDIRADIANLQIVLPPSGAVAGIYATVDRTRGVWKAPANISLNSVVAPEILITNDDQDSLNVDATGGKSINAIRPFRGKGILVWGARTLAGNDNEWRYVPVRRFYIMAEESIKKATEFVVFEPNDANTWLRVKTMIENFLITQWRQGALAGATPAEAFFVNVGLGVTMTTDDILNGYMNIEIGMAAVRPAEFIILKFSHKLQES